MKKLISCVGLMCMICGCVSNASKKTIVRSESQADDSENLAYYLNEQLCEGFEANELNVSVRTFSDGSQTKILSYPDGSPRAVCVAEKNGEIYFVNQIVMFDFEGNIIHRQGYSLDAQLYDPSFSWREPCRLSFLKHNSVNIPKGVKMSLSAPLDGDVQTIVYVHDIGDVVTGTWFYDRVKHEWSRCLMRGFFEKDDATQEWGFKIKKTLLKGDKVKVHSATIENGHLNIKYLIGDDTNNVTGDVHLELKTERMK